VILAGGNPDEILLEDAVDVCGILVVTGRYLPASRWVDTLIEREIQKNFDAFDAQLDGLMR
jgi:hypothetical protein